MRGVGRELRAQHRLADQVEVARVLEDCTAGDHAEALAPQVESADQARQDRGEHLLVAGRGVCLVLAGEGMRLPPRMATLRLGAVAKELMPDFGAALFGSGRRGSLRRRGGRGLRRRLLWREPSGRCLGRRLLAGPSSRRVLSSDAVVVAGVLGVVAIGLRTPERGDVFLVEYSYSRVSCLSTRSGRQQPNVAKTTHSRRSSFRVR